jgi:hypothetical protein
LKIVAGRLGSHGWGDVVEGFGDHRIFPFVGNCMGFGWEVWLGESEGREGRGKNEEDRRGNPAVSVRR